MNMPGFLKALPEGTGLAVKVQPRASKNEIGEAAGSELRIKVTAPPVDSAANDALLRLLADALGCGRNSVELLRGRSSRHKQLLIRGMTPEAVLERLARPRP